MRHQDQLVKAWLRLLRMPDDQHLKAIYNELFELATKGHDNFAQKQVFCSQNTILISPRYKTIRKKTWDNLNLHFARTGTNNILTTGIVNLALFLNLIFTAKLKKIIEKSRISCISGINVTNRRWRDCGSAHIIFTLKPADTPDHLFPDTNEYVTIVLLTK